MSDAPQRHTKTETEERNIALDLRGKLDAGELLTGTPTVEEVDTADLTLSSKTRNTSIITVNGLQVPISQGVQFFCTGGTAGTTYTIRVTCVTTATPAQTIIENLHLKVISD